jgi:hypothetical protein
MIRSTVPPALCQATAVSALPGNVVPAAPAEVVPEGTVVSTSWTWPSRTLTSMTTAPWLMMSPWTQIVPVVAVAVTVTESPDAGQLIGMAAKVPHSLGM